MSKNAYLDLQKKHRDEISNFPIAYAFNKEQLNEALVKLGVENVEECVTIMGHGDIVKKENAPKFVAMLKRQSKEVHDLLCSSEEVAEAAFLYEMDNHEYAINWDGDADVLTAFALDEEDLEKMNLTGAYLKARKQHYKNATEWGMI
jgi:(p)ppGpp synthase/HD superfamily hydrolase